jgi:hypothetical protein
VAWLATTILPGGASSECSSIHSAMTLSVHCSGNHVSMLFAEGSIIIGELGATLITPPQPNCPLNDTHAE